MALLSEEHLPVIFKTSAQAAGALARTPELFPDLLARRQVLLKTLSTFGRLSGRTVSSVPAREGKSEPYVSARSEACSAVPGKRTEAACLQQSQPIAVVHLFLGL